MEKSIENIWTKGFMNAEELVAPKVVNLYNQKSKLLLDKFKKTYKIDNKALIPMAILLGIGLSLFGYIILGIYTMILMTALFFFNRKLLQSLETINVSTNSYDYLTVYRKTIKKITNKTTKIVGLIFPLVIIPAYWLVFMNTEMYSDIITKVEPFKLVLSIVGLTILLSFICMSICKITTSLVYGKYLNKLDDLILDMNELKNN